MQQVIIFGVFALLIAAVIILYSYKKQRRSNDRYAKEYSHWVDGIFDLIHFGHEIGEDYHDTLKQVAKLKMEVCYRLRSRAIFVPLTYKANIENLDKAMREAAVLGNYSAMVLSEVHQWFNDDLKTYYQEFTEFNGGSWSANISCRFYQIYRPMLIGEIDKC